MMTSSPAKQSFCCENSTNEAAEHEPDPAISKRALGDVNSCVSETQKTPKIDSISNVQNVTYTLNASHADTTINFASCQTKVNKCTGADDADTDDEVSVPSSCEAGKTGGGDACDINNKSELTCTNCSPKRLTVCTELSPSTLIDFITVPETCDVNLKSQASSDSVEYTLSSSQESDHETAVHVSKYKSPIIQNKMAKIMGCNASMSSKVKKSHSARVQTHHHVKERCTQSLVQKTLTASMQTPQAHAKGARVQTSPAPLKSDAATATDSPERESMEAKKVIPHIRLRTLDEDTMWTASSKIKSIRNIKQKSSDRPKLIPNFKLSFKESAKSRIKSDIANSQVNSAGDKSKSVLKVAKPKSSLAKPKINFVKADQIAGAQKQTETKKLDFRARAKSKIGSLDNASHKAQGGDKKVYQGKLTFRETATSKVASLENMKHKPGGGDKQVFYQVVLKRSSLPNFGFIPINSNILSPNKIRRNNRNRSVSPVTTSVSRTTCSVLMTEPLKRVSPKAKKTTMRSPKIKSRQDSRPKSVAF